MIGTVVSHYRVLQPLGAGGMGIVYLAEDKRLNRKVALKFLPPALAVDEHARTRFLHEAQAASALDHPNVATVYDIGEWEGQIFIAMAYYEGETLKQRIERGPMTIAEVGGVAAQLAAGLAAAHRAGIVHRDLKPGNLMLTHDGQLKILDFGLAKIESDRDRTVVRTTAAGTTVGTVAFMAPEQARAEEVDARADIWAFGVVLYEMLTGRLPFASDSASSALLSLLNDTPAPVRTLRPDTPDEFVQVLDQALVKPRDQRTLTADQTAEQLRAWQARSSGALAPAPIAVPPVRRRLALALIVAALVLAAVGFGWLVRQNRRVRWAREQAIPQIEHLIEHDQFVGAFELAATARPLIPGDPAWKRLDPVIVRKVKVESAPPGARVFYRDPAARGGEWVLLGETPLVDAPVPGAFLEWKVERAGYETASDAVAPQVAGRHLVFTLHTKEQTPPGMVYVTIGNRPSELAIPGLDHLPPVQLEDFWIDAHEVTNREFKAFVDKGGYTDPSYWQQPFVRDGTTLTFHQAMSLFVDTTGRPGPATWESGSYTEGEDDFPVAGVSWFEAAAYAAFVGKSLPTIYHWGVVAEQQSSAAIVPRGNFGGRGPQGVGTTRATGRFGASDLPGNVKEWCWNRADATKRYILGGGWDEPVYMFTDPDARSPFQRAANFGFRCVKYSADERLAAAGAELVAFKGRDYSMEKPVPGPVFDVYRRMYSYDKGPLSPTTVRVDDSHPDWRRELVSYAAAYGNERIPAHVFLPKQGKPPFQVVVYFPGSGALVLRSSDAINTRNFDWVVRGGRAVVFPVYKSTFERGDGLESDYPNTSSAWRDHVVAWGKDVSRTLDYIESRQDLDHGRIGYYGYSWGAAMAPVYLAIEPRFKAATLLCGGYYLQDAPPEVDPLNFAPRVQVPVLLLSGRFDFSYPTDRSQQPFVAAFKLPDDEKRYVVYDTGHNIPRTELVKESLDWFDRFLGKVGR